MPAWEIRVGDARAELAKLAAGSVQACVTSTPYFGLRSYSTAPQVWGGDGSCGDAHEWSALPTGAGSTPHSGLTANADLHQPGVNSRNPSSRERGETAFGKGESDTCLRCGAWRGELGSENSVKSYVAHLVEVFREVRRVLHPTGTLVVVLGDSYANDTKWGGATGGKHANGLHGETGIGRGRRSTGLSPKQLLGVPWRVAFALQDAGWTLRSALPWVKRNCMPESVQDRPTSAIEYVFLLSKQARYFWDAEAVKRSAAESVVARAAYRNGGTKLAQNTDRNDGDKGQRTGFADYLGGRAYRNSDLFYDSLALTADDYAVPAPTETPATAGPVFPSLGLILDEDGDPLALDVNPVPFAGAHFACFPPKLVEPLIKATTSERGCCANPGCGAPYRRVLEREKPDVTPPTIEPQRYEGLGKQTGLDAWSGSHTPGWRKREPEQAQTVGWEPTCDCACSECGGDGRISTDILDNGPGNVCPVCLGNEHMPTVPCTVLDPFSGAGTTLMVALKVGRDAIGIELNGEYAALAEKRLRDELGTLFVTGGVVAPERSTA